jgi:hypothetical protein
VVGVTRLECEDGTAGNVHILVVLIPYGIGPDKLIQDVSIDRKVVQRLMSWPPSFRDQRDEPESGNETRFSL